MQWGSFNDLWTANQHIISRSCDTLYNATNNSDQETQDLYNAIKEVSRTTRVDHRFILAVIMQETKGCVRAGTTKSPDGIVNPGLLQSFKGTHSCNQDGKVQSPCPTDQILGMVQDGGMSQCIKLLPEGLLMRNSRRYRCRTWICNGHQLLV